jgi:hypothetical protein
LAISLNRALASLFLALAALAMYWPYRFLAAPISLLFLLHGKLPDYGVEIGFGHSGSLTYLMSAWADLSVSRARKGML